MAGSFSDPMEKYVLDNCFGQNTTRLSTGGLGTLYIALLESTADNANDTWDVGSTGECPGSTYARKGFTNSSSMWCNTTAGTGVKKLKKSIVVTTAAGSDWGTIGYFTICSSGTTGTGGFTLCWTSLTGGAKVINSGDSITVTTALSITLG